VNVRKGKNPARPVGRPSGPAFFLIIRGPLGSGKTTIAHAVAETLGAAIVSIDEILELDEWDGGSQTLFLRANVVAAERARERLTRGLPVVVDGNFYWKDVIDDLLERLPFPHRIFTLKVPLEVCIERDKGRALSYGEEGAKEVFAKVTSFECGIPIDATRSIPDVVREIRSHTPSR
jgi:thymidylate kinase